jgi:hypothetical protein
VIRGYHETITRAWLGLLDRRMPATAIEAHDSERFLEAHGALLNRDALLVESSRDRSLSIEARARFLEPDLSNARAAIERVDA